MKKGERLIISVGIIRDVVPEVSEYLRKRGLFEMPGLHIKGAAAITSPEQANLVTGKIKRLISDRLVQSGAKQIELFYRRARVFSFIFSDICRAPAM